MTSKQKRMRATRIQHLKWMLTDAAALCLIAIIVAGTVMLIEGMML
jgi:hypothetical protein